MHLGLTSPGSQECSTLTTDIDNWFESDKKNKNETEVQRKNREERDWVKVTNRRLYRHI